MFHESFYSFLDVTAFASDLLRTNTIHGKILSSSTEHGGFLGVGRETQKQSHEVEYYRAQYLYCKLFNV